MVRRGALLVVAILLLAGASSHPQLSPAPVITAATLALAAGEDLPDVNGTGRPIAAQPKPLPRLIVGAPTTPPVVALTFALDMNAQMAARARAGTTWINKDALAFRGSRNMHATLFMTGMWAEVS